jgi:hypothetical protein
LGDRRVRFPSSCLAFLGFTQNSFENRLEATSLFSKRFCNNSGNVPTNRKKGINIQKGIVHALPIFKRVLKIQKLLVLSG